MDALQNQLNEERAKNHKLQNLTKALKSSSDEKDKISQQLSMQLTDSQNQLQNIQSTDTHSDYIALQDEIRELRAAELENADLRQRVATESREREDSQSQLYRTRQKIEDLEREREDYRQWSIRLEQEQAGFDQRVNEAVSEALTKEGSNANDLELEVSRLRPMVTEMQAHIDQLEDDNRRLVTEKNNVVGAAGTGSTEHIRDLQTAVDKLSYERDQLRTRLADQERQTANLNNQLSSGANPPDVAHLRREIAELSAEKGVLSATINELQHKLGV